MQIRVSGSTSATKSLLSLVSVMLAGFTLFNVIDFSTRGFLEIFPDVLKSGKKLNAIFCILAHIFSNIESILIK